MPLDLMRAESIDAFVDTVREKAGGTVDIVASIAGVDIIKPFIKNDPSDWNVIINVNYVGAVRLLHRLLPSMIEAGNGGKIVTVASDAGRVGSSGETFYAGSKGAIIAFTKSLARELARYGINCNCVAPGPTRRRCSTARRNRNSRKRSSMRYRSSDSHCRAKSATRSCFSRRQARASSPARSSASAAG